MYSSNKTYNPYKEVASRKEGALLKPLRKVWRYRGGN